MSTKVFIPYVNDDGPSLVALPNENAAKDFCAELSRILAWRNRPRTDENDDDDFGREDFPPDDWADPNPPRDRFDQAVIYYDLDVEYDAIAAARRVATDFNGWGEYEP